MYWKNQKATDPSPISITNVAPSDAPSERKEEEFWIRNELYYLKKEDFEILQSKTAWLNDRIMDAAQRLICETLGDQSNYQSVLNTRKQTNMHFQPV